MDLTFGLFLQQCVITVRIEKYVWHLKYVRVVLDGQGKTARTVHNNYVYYQERMSRRRRQGASNYAL